MLWLWLWLWLFVVVVVLPVSSVSALIHFLCPLLKKQNTQHDVGVEIGAIQLLVACIRGFDGQGNRKEQAKKEKELAREAKTRRYCFEIITTERNYVFCSSSYGDRNAWVTLINEQKKLLMEGLLKQTAVERRKSIMASLQVLFPFFF